MHYDVFSIRVFILLLMVYFSGSNVEIIQASTTGSDLLIIEIMVMYSLVIIHIEFDNYFALLLLVFVTLSRSNDSSQITKIITMH